MGFRNIIEQAVQEIFSSMVFLDIEAIDEEQLVPMDGSMVSGMIGLAGDLQGSVLIHLPEKVAIAITNAFLGIEIVRLDEDVKDAVGELTNMVAGGIKFLLPEKSQEIELAIPSVVCGQGYSCEATGRFTRTAVLFELASGRFVVEIQIKDSGSLSSR
jgi:chemotaxis protein CheX